ncbi:MAG: SET domain-containing protein-lysine N-methyltransferase [Dehalococcoidia bacterium]|nr:SET domain-containing protein-lysine N-methyltransferase [Dehalococcoidia bacterium]
MVLRETDERFEVRASTIAGAGEGLFAQEPLLAGDRLEAIGVLVQSGSLEDRCTVFADEYKLRAGDLLLIPMGFAAKLNHSDQPNLAKVVEGTRLFMEALRDIAAGEELFFTYSDYARERFGIR